MSFADGHADYIRIKSYIPVKPYPCNMTGRCQSGCGSETGSCTYIMIRGQGWQLDTLPAQRIVKTGFAAGGHRPSFDGETIVGWPN